MCGLQAQNMSKEIDSVYNFQPSALTEQQQKAHLPVLDGFFNQIRSDTGKYLPLLRHELQAKGHPPYFYFDCGHLLSQLSNQKNDLQLGADAIAKCDVRDVMPRNYVGIVEDLALRGANTTAAAISMLNDTDFSFYLPEHSMNFTLDYCLLYCLLPVKPALYVDQLTSLFWTTNSPKVQKAIITMVWFAYSCKGDEFLNVLDSNNTLNMEVYGLVRSYNLNLQEKVTSDFMSPNEHKEYEAVKKEALGTFSDESIEDLFSITKVFRNKCSCKD